MAFYSTIQELIDSVKDMEISYRNLHTNIYIKNKEDIIKIPYKSIIQTYLPFFQDTVVTAKLNPDEIVMYRYKPKMLSFDLYGTTELWSSLMELNGVLSIVDFTLETPKVFHPNSFMKKLNEVMIMERIIE